MSANLKILLAVIFLDGMVMGIVIPATPHLIAEVQNTDIGSILIWGGILTATFGTTQLLISPSLGAVSDRIGRRKVLLIAQFGMVLEFIILLFANALWLIILARALAGAASANRAVVSAAITDITSEDARASALGKQTAAFAAGVVFGPTLGSLALLVGTHTPFLLALVMIAANLILTAVFFKETKTSSAASQPQTPAHRLLIEMAQLLPTAKGARLLSYLFYSMGFIAYPALWSYYAQGVLGWSALQLGLAMTIFCASLIVANAWALERARRWLGSARAISFALFGNSLAGLFLAIGAADTWIFVALPLIALMTVADPLILARYSKMGHPDEQGLLQGQMSAMRALGIILSPVLLGVVLAKTNGANALLNFSGAIFLIVALFFAVSLLFHIYLERRQARSQADA